MESFDYSYRVLLGFIRVLRVTTMLVPHHRGPIREEIRINFDSMRYHHNQTVITNWYLMQTDPDPTANWVPPSEFAHQEGQIVQSGALVL